METWGAIGGCGPWEVTLRRCSCHMRSPGSLYVFAFLAQYSMNPYMYPTGFGRCPCGCSASLCKRCTGFGIIYGQSWGKYRACRTYKYGRLFRPRTTLLGRLKIVGSPSLKAVHAHLGYTAPHGSKTHRKIVQTRTAVFRSD